MDKSLNLRRRNVREVSSTPFQVRQATASRQRALTACVSVLSVFTCACVLSFALTAHLFLDANRHLDALSQRVATLSRTCLSLPEEFTTLQSSLQLQERALDTLAENITALRDAHRTLRREVEGLASSHGVQQSAARAALKQDTASQLEPLKQSWRQQSEQLTALSARVEQLRAELERVARRPASASGPLAANAANISMHHAASGSGSQAAAGGGSGSFASHNPNHNDGDKESWRPAGRLAPEKDKHL